MLLLSPNTSPRPTAQIECNSPPKLGGVPSAYFKREAGWFPKRTTPSSLTSFEASAYRARASRFAKPPLLTPEELRWGRLFPSSAEEGWLRGQKSREATLARADGVVLVNPPIIRC